MSNINKTPLLPPFKRFCVTIGNLPSSYVDSMSYYECLMWLCKFLQEQVIPTVNENAEAVNELINWFNNLDVQDEIDNKLDEMVESGELQEIISEYLGSNAIFGFETVEEMKSATNLIDGSYARTMGYYSTSDGGGALYLIKDTTSESDYYETLDSGKYAVLVNKFNVNTKMFGVVTDGETDCSTKLQTAVNYVKNHSIDQKLVFAKGSYLMNSGVIIPYGVIIEGSYSTIYANFNGGYLFGLNTNNDMTDWVVPYGLNKIRISNLVVLPKSNAITTCGVFVVGGSMELNNITITHMYNSIKQVPQYIEVKSMKTVYVNEGLGDYDCSFLLGDGLDIDQCGEIRFKIDSSAGVTIKNSINLGLKLINCKGALITGLHNEYDKEISFEGSNVSLENSYITRIPARENTIVVNNALHSTSIVNIKNVGFFYYYNKNYDPDTIYNDVRVFAGNTVMFENVYRGSNFTGGGYDEATSSICVNGSVVNPLYRKYMFNGKTIQNLENIKIPYETNYSLIGVSKAVLSGFGNYNSNDGTLYFCAIDYLDTTRLIKSYSQYREDYHTTITSDNTYITLVFSQSNVVSNSTLRVYRGSSSGNYQSICDIPVFNAPIWWLDDKVTVGKVAKWQPIGDHTFNEGLTAFEYETIGSNVRIRANSIPTKGTWTKGDIIINNNLSAGGAYGWICVAGGTPGTWKKISTIEA